MCGVCVVVCVCCGSRVMLLLSVFVVSAVWCCALSPLLLSVFDGVCCCRCVCLVLCV